MIRKILVFVMISFAALNNCFAAGFYCGKNIVAIGDTTYDVSMKCQKPIGTDSSEVEVIQEIAHGEWKKVHINRETWLFNWGPNSFMKKLIFVNNKLQEIKDLGYGYLEKDIGRFGNTESKLYIQMSKPEVLIHWGNPDNKTDVIEERLYKVNEHDFLKYNVTISKWVYNFGSNQFLKILVFENDRLIEINSGKCGYDK